MATLARNGENQRKREALDHYRRKLDDAARRVERLKQELAAAQENWSKVLADFDDASKSAQDLEDESTAELEQQIADFESLNAQIAANAQTDFEVKEKRVFFSGSVIMKNERFYLTADTLVAHLKDKQSGLDFAEAQGNVVVRMVENGRETGSSGLAKTAIFRPETGEIVLKGWPQLRMGNKAHVASAATTEMSLFTDGRMKTSGRNQTMIVP